MTVQSSSPDPITEDVAPEYVTESECMIEPEPEFAPQEPRSQRVVRNVAVTMATQLVSWGLTFAVTFFLPRYVGAAGLGQLAFAASFISVFGVFVPLGTSTVLIKEIARDKESVEELLPAALALRLGLAILATVLAVAAVSLLGYSPLIRVLVTVAALGMVVGTVNDALGATLQGLENFTRQSAAILVEKFLASGLTVFLVLIHAPLWQIAAVGLFTGLVSVGVRLTAFSSARTLLHLPKIASLRFLAVAGLPFLGYGVFNTLYGQTDPIVLKLVTNDETVGWYSAAFRLVGTTLFLPSALMSVLMPTFFRLYKENDHEFHKLARRVFDLIMLCAVPMSLILILIPEQLVTLLHYPKSFENSIPVLRVGGVTSLLWYAACVIANLVTARDAQTPILRASMMACVLGVPLCFLGSFVGDRVWHNGAVGALASDTLLETYLIVCYLRMLPRGMFGMGSLSLIARACLAALPMVYCLHTLSESRFKIGVAVAALILYVVLCRVLRCYGPRDVALVSQIFARKLGASKPPRPLRVLMVTPYYSPGVGGAPRLMQSIVDHLTGQGHGVEVLSYGSPMNNDCAAFDPAQSYKIHRVPAQSQTGRTTVQMGLRLLGLLLTRRYDVLLCGVAYPSAILAYGAFLLFQTPYLVYSHGEDASPIKNTRRKRFFLAHALQSAAVVLVNSRFTRREIMDFDVKDHNIVIIPPGIDPTPYQHCAVSDVEALRGRLGLNGKRVVLTVARLTERKGHDMIVRSLRQVRQAVPDVHYLIVGKGDTGPLLSLAESEGVADCVTITPYIPETDLYALYHLCDLYAMVSRRDPITQEVEGFGIVYLEAGACGKACLAGSEGGSGDAVLDGVTGFVVDPTDVHQIAEGLTALLSDPATAVQMGSAARTRVWADFRSEDLLAKLEGYVRYAANRPLAAETSAGVTEPVNTAERGIL